jgi:hypothetical protein
MSERTLANFGVCISMLFVNNNTIKFINYSISPLHMFMGHSVIMA